MVLLEPVGIYAALPLAVFWTPAKGQWFGRNIMKDIETQKVKQQPEFLKTNPRFPLKGSLEGDMDMEHIGLL